MKDPTNTTVPIMDESTARRLAVEADVDPRTIKNELARPGSVRGMPGHRARAVLKVKGLIT